MKNQTTSLLKTSALGLALVSIFKSKVALAVCPICTIAVASGVGFSRWIGIDDTVAGLWIGALTLSMAFWNINWFDKKKIHFKFRNSITVTAYYLIVVFPLWSMGIIGNQLGALKTFGVESAFSVDKLSLGIMVGTFAFWTSVEWYAHIKANNNGHAHFPFEKVVIPSALLVILSFAFFFLTK
jgi:hypothetical protein